MASEDQSLLERAVATGHHPKVALLLLAPRDFIANSFPVQTNSGHLFRYFANRAPIWERISLKEDPLKNFEKLAQQSSIYKNRGHFARICEIATCGFLHRAPNMWYAQRPNEYWKNFEQPKLLVSLNLAEALHGGGLKAADTSEAPKKHTHAEEIELLMNYYKGEYAPLNYKRFDVQMTALEKTLQFAKKNDILPIVVNMPRGSGNDALLPADFKARYADTLADLCKRQGVTLYNFMGTSEFTADDNFSDAVHLSNSGARKFIELLSHKLAADSAVCKKLQSN